MSMFDSFKKAFHSADSSSQERNSPSPGSGADKSSAGIKQPAPGSSEGKTAAHPATDWRVLFVGGNPQWFQLVQHDLRIIQPAWLCQHAANAAGARSLLASSAPFDALVLDGRLSDGVKLLNQLEQRGSPMICLVRYNTSDRDALTQWNRFSATLLSEDCSAAMLASSLKRTRRLRDWMADQAIKKLLPQIHKLPTAPMIHAQVTEHLDSPNGSMITVARLISQDPVMSAKILQVVNSVQFGRSQEVTDTADAVIIVGGERIKSLLLLAGVFSQYSDADCPGFSPEPIWDHSVEVGMMARTIAFAETKDGATAESAFTAGLLHDVGKLILAANLPQMHEQVRQLETSRQISNREAERMVMGTTHAEFAACLLATWGLPLPVLEAIAWHHEPERSSDTGFSLLAAVHAANAFTHENAPASGGACAPEPINLEFLMRSGLGDCRNRWRIVCGHEAKPEEESGK